METPHTRLETPADVSARAKSAFAKHWEWIKKHRRRHALMRDLFHAGMTIILAPVALSKTADTNLREIAGVILVSILLFLVARVIRSR